MDKPASSMNAPQFPAKKLEISIHSFKDRILENCVYVDKTPYIYELISNESNCFLSRPRRFGKSLLISTLKEIFSGNKELFKNCWIYDKIGWEKYNIIHLDFINVDFNSIGLERAIYHALDSLAEPFNIKLSKETIKERFLELIKLLSKEKKVVILIDEYDKPITEYIDDIPEAEKNRDILKNFYSILKSQVSNIRFLLITGVSKFSRVSIFSDLNHLADISIDPQYSNMLGYTAEEIEDYFSDYINNWEKREGQNRSILFERLKDYYDGYSWDGENFVYNPFSILSFFRTYQFRNYWFATGSPTFLVKKLKNTDIAIDRYECLSVTDSFFDKFDISSIDISVLLFQTGYLTIKTIEENEYILSYPNREVRESFFRYLLEGYSGKSHEAISPVTKKIRQTLNDNNIDAFIQSLKILLSSIPYNIQIENREAYYHSLIYIALRLSMFEVQCEIQSAMGRSDIVVLTDHYAYVMEFKLGSATTALNQIEEKKYYLPYLDTNKRVILLGIGLNEAERNIGEWKIREAKRETDELKETNKPETKVQAPNNEKNEMERQIERQMAKRMLADGLPIEMIVKYTGLSEEEIKQINLPES
ncbi:MAG: AAA family ATPase [Candidatus Omnitrophota bacterium]